MIYDDGKLRVLSVFERERVLGFDQMFTVCASLLGHAMCPSVLSWLFAELLHGVGHLACALDPCWGLQVGALCRAWTENPDFTRGEGDTQESRVLVTEYLRIAEKNGSDVRLDVGLPFKPRAWPRASIPSHTWHWNLFTAILGLLIFVSVIVTTSR
eukprot:6281187-Amphidinium_carterae.2